MDFTFIELMCSPRRSNPFSGYSENDRAFKIIEQVFKEDPGYVPSPLVRQAMELYFKWLAEASPSYNHWKASKLAAEKTQTFFKEFTYAEKNPKTGLPLWKPKDITSAIKDSEDNIKTLDSLQKKVESELLETVKTKGMRQINYYEE